MTTTTQEYILMCAKVMDFYNANKQMLSTVEGLEGHFTDLRMLLINLSNEHERTMGHFLPILNEKENQKNKLEKLFLKFRHAILERTPIGELKKTSTKKTAKKDPPQHLTPAEIIEQYTHIRDRSKKFHKELLDYGISKDEFRQLDTQVTQFILSLPVINLLEEKINMVSLTENKHIVDIQYLLTKVIDKQMMIFKDVDTALYAAYTASRKRTDGDFFKGSKDRRDAYIVA